MPEYVSVWNGKDPLIPPLRPSKITPSKDKFCNICKKFLPKDKFERRPHICNRCMAELDRERIRKDRQKAKREGKCYECRRRKAKVGGFCLVCSKANSDRKKARRLRLEAEGVCRICGIVYVEGRTECWDCSDYSRRVANARRALLIAKGLCRACGQKAKVKPNGELSIKCEECLAKEAARKRKYRAGLKRQ